MAAADLLVLLVALLVGLLLGGVLAWLPLLLRTGHPPRPQLGEWGAMPSPRGRARPEGGRGARATAPALLALAAVVAAGLVALLAAPPAGAWGDLASGLPGGPLLAPACALGVVIAYALPAWMGVRR